MSHVNLNNSVCDRDDNETSYTCLNPESPSCCFPDFPYLYNIFLGTFFILIGFVGGSGNFITLIVLTYARRNCKDPLRPLMSYTTFLLLHLSFADFLMCSFVFSLEGFNLLMRKWPFGLTLCEMSGFITHFSAIASRNLLAVTTIYRTLTLWCPKVSCLIFNCLHGYPAIIVIWLFSSSFPLYVICRGGYGYSRLSGNCETIRLKSFVVHKIYAVYAAIPLIITVICLFLIGKKLRLNWSEIKQFKNMSPATRNQLKERETRIMKLLLTLTAVYITTITPVVVAYFFSNQALWAGYFLYFRFVTALYFPSNFIVYIIRMKDYREAYGTFFTDAASYWKANVQNTAINR